MKFSTLKKIIQRNLTGQHDWATGALVTNNAIANETRSNVVLAIVDKMFDLIQSFLTQ